MALPIDYKLKNIEATEKAAQHILQQDYWSQITSKSTPAYKRFEVDQSVTASMLPYGANMDHAIPSAGISDLNQHNKRPLKSTDDLALDRFKKVSIFYYYNFALIKLMNTQLLNSNRESFIASKSDPT